ncbi:hypothetical protein ACK33R_04525 [Aeromonas rivipollensis]|uniref:hypothetical protein n=1 Tax=Aeromonas rivipollensis TaxID=948519 RepID=UPI003989E8EA
MKHYSTIIAVIGLLSVGVMIGLVISDNNSSYTSLISTIAAIFQSCIGGLTLLVAYWVYKSWQRQLLYPRYIEAMNSLYDEFHKIHQTTSDYRDLSGDEFNAIAHDYDVYVRIFNKYQSLSSRHELLIRRFARESTVDFILGDAVTDAFEGYIQRLDKAKNETSVREENEIGRELYKYTQEYNKWHDARLP